MSEAAFQRQVIEYALLNGWEVYHVPDSRRVTACGFPDCLAIHEVRTPGLIAFELKTDTGKVRREQAVWRLAFERAGVPYYLWRPSQWDEVAAVLGG